MRNYLERRAFLHQGSTSLGAAALSGLLGKSALGTGPLGTSAIGPDLPPSPFHFKGKAKRVIYLFFSGGPSHIDMFDYKPQMHKFHGTELPDSIRNGQRITGMTSGQKNFPCVAPMFKFAKYGKHQTWVNSDLLPHTASIVDDICLVKSVHTEAINHDPAITYITTGAQQPGRASMGAWLSYGLGSDNENLPAFTVMISQGRGQKQALYARLWGSGFLPSKHQGFNSARAATLSFIFPIPMGSIRPQDGSNSTPWQRLIRELLTALPIPKPKRALPNMRWPIECKRPCPT